MTGPYADDLAALPDETRRALLEGTWQAEEPPDGEKPPHPLRAQDVPALICKDIA